MIMQTNNLNENVYFNFISISFPYCQLENYENEATKNEYKNDY